MADVYRVHDYNYLMKVLQMSNKLSLFQSPTLSRFGNVLYIPFNPVIDRDSTVSEKTWEASLIACGAVIEACNKVMRGEVRNAFCAVRPPGHHAGVFGRTK